MQALNWQGGLNRSRNGGLSAGRHRWVWVAVFSVAMTGCALSGSVAGPAGDDLAGSASMLASERQIEETIHHWFARLERPPRAPGDLSEFLSHGNVELRLADETIRGREGLLAWLARPNPGFATVKFFVGAVDFAWDAPSVIRAQFSVDQHAWDEEGVLHLSRKIHTWRVQLAGAQTAILLDAEQTAVLPHQGTGTKILCL